MVKIQEAPLIIRKAWSVYSDKKIIAVEDFSRNVSQNAVYQLTLDDGEIVIAKSSTYGTFEHFIEDHEGIYFWSKLINDSRFKKLLARPSLKEKHVFAYQHENVWVVFYQKLSQGTQLPRKLNERQIKNFATEMAEFHNISERIADKFLYPSKSIYYDILILYRRLANEYYADSLGLTRHQSKVISEHCQIFLSNITKGSYATLSRIPVLVDWNIGNFTVENVDEKMKLASRWDYDWFRFEPAVLDFYFFARLTREEGDQDSFSYTASPLVEDRFLLFLENYAKVRRLTRADIDFIKEAYRFFILNYVIKDGHNFFREDIYQRLKNETVEVYLENIDKVDFSKLYSLV